MKICVLGLGYVGLTLALTLADCGFQIYGIDSNKKIISNLKAGRPTLSEKDVGLLLSKHLGKKFFPSEKISDEDYEVFIISVGTPLNPNNMPILEYITKSAETISQKLKKGNLIILRSTVPIGITRKTVIPILEKKSRLKNDKDFDVAFAPERTAEGVAIAELRINPQIIGGFSEKAVKRTAEIFKKMTKTVVPVSSIEAAEMIKLIDNTYRDTRFAYANEIAIICEMLNLNAKECIDKANFNYPRNSIPSPSPGVGGPCLSKDPHILVHVGKKKGFEPPIVKHSRWINEYMPTFLATKILQKIKKLKKGKNKMKIFVMGFAFKGHPETDDVRDSPTILLVEKLKSKKIILNGYDPVVSEKIIESLGVKPTTIEEGFRNADCIVVMNNHKSYSSIEIKKLLSTCSKPCVFVDCWNMFEKISSYDEIIYTGVGLD